MSLTNTPFKTQTSLKLYLNQNAVCNSGTLWNQFKTQTGTALCLNRNFLSSSGLLWHQFKTQIGLLLYLNRYTVSSSDPLWNQYVNSNGQVFFYAHAFLHRKGLDGGRPQPMMAEASLFFVAPSIIGSCCPPWNSFLIHLDGFLCSPG